MTVQEVRKLLLTTKLAQAKMHDGYDQCEALAVKLGLLQNPQTKVDGVYVNLLTGARTDWPCSGYEMLFASLGMHVLTGEWPPKLFVDWSNAAIQKEVL